MATAQRARVLLACESADDAAAWLRVLSVPDVAGGRVDEAAGGIAPTADARSDADAARRRLAAVRSERAKCEDEVMAAEASAADGLGLRFF